MSTSVKPIAVLGKAFQILEYMVNYPYGIPLGQLSKGVDMNKTTVFRILSTLEDLGYVAQNPDTSEYKLDYKFLTFAAMLNDMDVKRVATPHMQRLTEETLLSVSLALLDNDTSLNLDRTAAPWQSSLKIETVIGFRSPLYCCASGKAMLSGFSETELEQYLQRTPLQSFTPHTITNPQVLRKQLLDIRQKGYAVEDMENENNIVSIAAPLKNVNSEIFAAITLINIKTLMPEDVIETLGQQLSQTAQTISRELGCLDYQKLNFR